MENKLTVTEMLQEWGKAVEEPQAPTPVGKLPLQLTYLRKNLLEEEFNEYLEAIGQEDVVAIADALGDMLYIIYGTARVYGIPLDDVVAEIHRSNMTKVVGGAVLRREDGKVMKPPTYDPPNLREVMGI